MYPHGGLAVIHPANEWAPNYIFVFAVYVLRLFLVVFPKFVKNISVSN